MTVLNKKDLNDFKLKLNKFSDEVVRTSKDVLVLKSKYVQKEVTKEQVAEAENLYKIKKEEFKKNSDISIFVKNLSDIKQALSKTKKTSEEYEILKKQLKDAKFFLKEAKLAVKERGSTGELEKMNNIAMKLNNIKFRYKPNHPYAVNGVSVEIQDGEYVAIIGHNGSGKSTLSKLLIGVESPQSGYIEVFGNRATANNLPLIRKFLGIVFQNPDNQFIGSTVRDDIAFGLENRRVAPTKMWDIIENAAKKVKINDFLDHEPLMLSGGQKQRVAIASALALSPDILIFDEATSMLDPRGKREVKEIMVDLKNSREKTIFSITHDMDEILNADKVMVMNKGELVKFGTPQEILSDKDFLRSIHLDIPFVAQVEEALEAVGIKVSKSNSIEELAVKLCKK